MTPLAAFAVIWVGFALSWVLASRWSAGTASRVTTAEEWPYLIIQILGFTLLIITEFLVLPPFLELWRPPRPVAWLLALLTALGLAICWWARIHLGKLWSLAVARKAEHRIVSSGPYAHVRHPIYSGLMIAVIATALASGAVPTMVGAALACLSLVMKARIEERFLREELGAAAYDAYAQSTPAFFPFPGRQQRRICE